MARVQGLTEQRHDAATVTNMSSTELSQQSATLEMCLRVQKAAGDVLAQRERNMTREARLPPQADPQIRQRMRTHPDYGEMDGPRRHDGDTRPGQSGNADAKLRKHSEKEDARMVPRPRSHSGDAKPNRLDPIEQATMQAMGLGKKVDATPPEETAAAPAAASLSFSSIAQGSGTIPKHRFDEALRGEYIRMQTPI